MLSKVAKIMLKVEKKSLEEWEDDLENSQNCSKAQEIREIINYLKNWRDKRGADLPRR